MAHGVDMESSVSNDNTKPAQDVELAVVAIEAPVEDAAPQSPDDTVDDPVEEVGDESGAGEESSNEPGKMFIGGLSNTTDTDALQEYFSQFGPVKETVVMKDPMTHRSRGFGFVTFKDPASVQKVMEQQKHTLQEKQIDPKVAIPRKQLVTKTKKLFVGGIGQSTTDKDLENFFGKFGTVVECAVMMDKQSHRPRGFAFVTFEDEDSVDQICKEHFLEINGKTVEAKKAQPRDVMHPTGRFRAARPYGGFNNVYSHLIDYYNLAGFPRMAVAGNRRGPNRPVLPMGGFYHQYQGMDPHRMRAGANAAMFYEQYALGMARPPMSMPIQPDRHGGVYGAYPSSYHGRTPSSNSFQQPMSPTGPAQGSGDGIMGNSATTTSAIPQQHMQPSFGGYGSSTSSANALSNQMGQMALNGHAAAATSHSHSGHGQSSQQAAGPPAGFEQHPSTSYTSSYTSAQY